MIGLLFLGSMGLRHLTFAPEPPQPELLAGRLVCRRGDGPDRTLLGDKVVMGTWFDGRIRRGVDTAFLVGPDMVARWLGFLAEQEARPASELNQRWAYAKRRLDHSLTFIVRLAAMPKVDPLEFGVGSPADPTVLDHPRFKLSFDRKGQDHDSTFVEDGEQFALAAKESQSFRFEKYEPGDIYTKPFFSFTDLEPLFLADGEAVTKDDGIPLGDCYGAVYVVSFPVSGKMFGSKALDLTVTRGRKREDALFLMQKPKPGSDSIEPTSVD